MFESPSVAVLPDLASIPEEPASETHAAAFGSMAGVGPSALLVADARGGTGRSPSAKAYDAPEIDNSAEAVGARIVTGMARANHGGVEYPGNYKRTHPGMNPNWEAGYTSSEHFYQPYEATEEEEARAKKEGKAPALHAFDFRLKRGHSASKAIKAWIKGTTIAECLSTIVAVQIDAMRATIGDEHFDREFGHENATFDDQIPEESRLRIRPGVKGTPLARVLKDTKLATTKHEGEGVTDQELTDNLKPGQWYYFSNHPQYLLKHPGEPWQGENAIYMGYWNSAHQFAGLGATTSLDQMLQSLANAYNAEQTDGDRAYLRRKGILTPDGKYTSELYDPKKGKFPTSPIKVKDLLEAPAYTLRDPESGKDVTRKGGLVGSSGAELDTAALEALRKKPL